MRARKPEPNFERFLKVVRRQGEPDRVPFAELFHDYEIMAAIQGPPPGDADGEAAWRAKFWRDLGYDYISQGANVGFPHGSRMAADTADQRPSLAASAFSNAARALATNAPSSRMAMAA